MLVELHILQNFAPANLNRDDTGMPKDCEFGGYRRARISSQCFKRAVRQEFDAGLIEPQFLAIRTKRLVGELVKRLQAQGKDAQAAQNVVKSALGGVKLEVNDDGKTQYLLFLGSQEISNLTDLCVAHWDRLVSAAADATPDQGGTTRRRAKSVGKDAVPKEVRDAADAILDGGKAADLALFGRMLADLPDKSIDAASQVAHAISTNRISMELDYYTAVDDLQPEDTASADMIGTVGFNSGCFYRYSNVDMRQLTSNLQGDEDLVRQTLEAFLRASVSAVPTGKQNSMAAHNPPSFVLAVVRKSSLWNLANAFLKPVRPREGKDLAACSVEALDRYLGKLVAIYGEDSIVGAWAVSIEDDGVTHLKDRLVPNFDDLVSGVLAHAAADTGNVG
ncbi:MAG: type I-E CRISPR-associated protein Cas7/Cse4/CasC [Anaerolineaceae bacterium]|nr:type I-E CRISPR-associated protein Cas7/Cse4/CasC [Anaerolineaceae bacterium]